MGDGAIFNNKNHPEFKSVVRRSLMCMMKLIQTIRIVYIMHSDQQQPFVRRALKLLEMRRKDLAVKMDISQRRLDAWLLPNDSPGYRKMPQEIHGAVCDLLRAKVVEKNRGVKEATFSSLVAPVFCDKFQFTFPTLYRFSYSSDDDEISLECYKKNQPIIYPTPANTFDHCTYSLSENSQDGKIFRGFVEPVAARNKPIDSGWVYVLEHRTIERADAALRSFFLTHGKIEGCSAQLYYFGGKIFTIWRVATPVKGLVDVATIYASDEYLDEISKISSADGQSFSMFDSNTWGICIGADGEVIPVGLLYAD